MSRFCSPRWSFALLAIVSTFIVVVIAQSSLSAPGVVVTDTPLTIARNGAATTVLPNGTILATGGTDSSGNPLATSEYLGSGSPAGSMLTPRSGHIAVALEDGRVLVTGGRTTGGAVTNATEIFTAASTTWAAGAAMLEARTGATATLLADGRVFIAGGNNGSTALRTTEIYDPATGQFSNGPNLAGIRQNHAAALLRDGRVVLAGGSNGAAPLASIEIFDPSANAIATASGALATARSGLSATTLLKQTVLLAGGTGPNGAEASTEIFDPETGTVSPGPAMSTPRTGHSALLLPNNNTVMMVGGTTASAAAEIYVSWQNAFASFGTLSTARSGVAAAAEGQSGTAHVAGGQDSNGAVLTTADKIRFPMVKTDKPDYQPGDTAVITGSGFGPNETVALSIVEDPDDGDGPHNPTVTTDSTGAFSTQLPIDEADLNVRFTLTATGQNSGLTAGTTFTDSRTVTSVTLNGGSSVTVASGATITAVVNVTTDNSGGNQNWRSTGWLISTTAPGTVTCVNHSNHDASGSYSETFSITAPATGGTYNAYFIAYSNDTCDQQGSATFALTNGVMVTASTTTSVAAVPVSPSTYGTSVQFKATVTPASGPTPSCGTLDFKEGATTISSGNAVSGGTATFTTSTLSATTHSVTAVYTPAASACNFTGSTSSPLSYVVTPKALTASIIGNPAKPYDGNTTATLTPANFSLTGLVGTESITVTKTTGIYNSKDVAIAASITATLAGTDFTAGGGTLLTNYTLPTTASGAGHITALTVTGSIIGDPTKPYDGNTNATLTAANFSLSGLIGSEAFTVTKTTGTYNSKDVLTANTVSTSLAAGDFTPVSGAIATNYTLPTTASGAGHITPASVTPAVTAIDKPYDGNNTATINACTLTGVISPDVVTCSDSATFSSPNVGTWTVTATGITLGGAQAGNYVLSSNSATTTAKINPKALTASIINNPTKPYDGNTTATLTPANFSVIGIVGAESITVTKTTGIYNSKDVATASTVTATLAGTDFAAGGGTLLTNYMLPTTVSGTGHITAVTVTASIIGNPTKPYDGNTYATLTAANFSLAGLVAGESITVTKTSGTYNDKNVAAASTVTATLAGGDFAPVGGALLTNYALPVSASGGGHITARALAVIATGVNKVYDSTTAAMVTLSDNRLSGDVFTDNYGSATFATPNVGTLIPVTVNGIWIAGTDSGNYTFNSTTTTVANITPASPTTTLASSLSTATTPVGVVLKATVASTVVPTGSVKFTDITTSTVLGTISLASGQATLTVTTLGVGPHVVSASYIPDTANFTGSVSGADDAPGVTITGPPSGTVQAVNTTFNFTATFTDTTPQTHSGAWSFDTASIPGTVDDVNGTVTASYPFATAGVYGVKLTVNDGAGGITIANTVSSANAPLNLSAQVVVYDPSSGFVTGGGWINSPAGAYTANTTLTGKATFGFVSKYEKGANVPTGETEFNFQVANFNFHSALYQWLVISGPMAQYKGSGTINGSGNYNFILTGRDGALVGGNSPDGFRIKITDPISGSVIYDNLLSTDDSMTSANTQTLGGGSIVVHSK